MLTERLQQNNNGSIGVVWIDLLLTRRRSPPCTLVHNNCSDGGSCIPWHRDDEHTSGNIHSPKIIVTVSLGIEVSFMVRRCGEQSSRIPELLQRGHIGCGWACAKKNSITQLFLVCKGREQTLRPGG